MKKINKLLYLFFVSVFIFSACNNLTENSLKEEIPEGYGLVSGQIDCNSHYRSAFNVVLPDQNIFYKVIAEDSEGVLDTVTATAVKKNATFVLQDTIKKNTAKYQLMLPYGTWNITIEGYTAYSYDAETEEEVYTTKTLYGSIPDVVVSSSNYYHSNLNIITIPALLDSDETGTVNLPISVTAATVLGAKAEWVQNIDGTDTPLTQTLLISSGETAFTMIADNGVNASGVPSGSYFVRFSFYDSADCAGTLLYTCTEAINVLYKVLSETNCWVKSEVSNSPHLFYRNYETDEYVADFIITDKVIYDALNDPGKFAGKGYYSLNVDDIIISIDDPEISHDIQTEINVTAAKNNAAGPKTDITADAADWNIALLNDAGDDITAAGGFIITGKKILCPVGIPYDETFKLYVSFCYNNKYYSCTFDLKVQPEYNFYSIPIDVSTGEKATAASTEVYFGVFPKTVLPLSSAVTINEKRKIILGNNTYYLGSDGEYYAKVLENGYGTSYKYSDNSSVKQSSANSYRYFKLEPIKWKVLTTNYNSTGKALLHADMAIMCNIPFYVSTSSRTISGTTVTATDYKYSTVRAYLNGAYEAGDTQAAEYLNKGFMQTVFKSQAQSLIASTILSDSSNVNDKIFLLNLTEVTSTALGFPTGGFGSSAKARIRRPTDYAKANYSYDGGSDVSGAKYMLRGAPSGSSIRKVDNDGDTSTTNNYGVGSPTDKKIALVPALCITLE